MIIRNFIYIGCSEVTPMAIGNTRPLEVEGPLYDPSPPEAVPEWRGLCFVRPACDPHDLPALRTFLDKTYG